MKLQIAKTSTYDYDLPKHLIASKPIYPPSNAKLLIYNRQKNKIIHTIFKNILDFIPQDTAILFNDTKVIKARIFGRKQTGGKIELLLDQPLKNKTFSCYIRGKVYKNSILSFDNDLQARVLEVLNNGSRIVEFVQYDNILDFVEIIKILNQIGHIPLPPYINRADEESDNTDYQTLWAKNYGAVASPTASLHFTSNLLKELKSKFKTSYLTLHVGSGTFKPVECENILEHKMHSEYYEVPTKSQDIINSDKKILAIGTTVARTVEYYYQTKKTNGKADIFINPLNPAKRVDFLLTNFHFPKSTLIMLVASFIGIDKTLNIYKEAIKNNYRFYSYGDAMLII